LGRRVVHGATISATGQCQPSVASASIASLDLAAVVMVSADPGVFIDGNAVIARTRASLPIVQRLAKSAAKDGIVLAQGYPVTRKSSLSLVGMQNGAKALYADNRGAVFVEYAVVIGAIAFAGSLGLIAVGIALVHSFDFVRGLLLCPIP
jgi:hypothetical protein